MTEASLHTRRLTRTCRSASRRDPVARLVETTAGNSWGVIPTASAEPLCTTVPTNEHEDISASGDPTPTAAPDLAADSDSAVDSRRRSAGTTAPISRCTNSPGTNFVTSMVVGRPSLRVVTM